MGTTLAQRWKEAREARKLGSNELDRAIGSKQFTTRIESGEKKNPELPTIVRAAEALGVRPAWLAFGVGPKVGGEEVDRIAEMPAVTFVAKLLARQSLIRDVQNNPTKPWKLWHLVDVVDANLSDENGNPTRGTWIELLDERSSGVAPAKAVGGVERMREIMAADPRKPGSQPVPTRAKRHTIVTSETPVRRKSRTTQTG